MSIQHCVVKCHGFDPLLYEKQSWVQNIHYKKATKMEALAASFTKKATIVTLSYKYLKHGLPVFPSEPHRLTYTPISVYF